MADRQSWHLGDEALLGYLDGVLDPASHIEAEAHLAACAECRAGLAHWQALFARLELARDLVRPPELSGAVVARLHARHATGGALRGLLLGEVAGAMAAVAALSLGALRALEPLLFDPRLLVVRLQVARWMADFAATLRPLFDLSYPLPMRASMIELRLPALEFPWVGWAGLLGGALLLGVIGNGLLLRARTGSESPGQRPGAAR